MSLVHYFSHVQDNKGNSKQGASITVYLAGTTTKVVLYNKNGGGQSNPVGSDENGFFDFYVKTEDHDESQLFDLLVAHPDLTTKTFENVEVFNAAGSVQQEDYTGQHAILATQGSASVPVNVDVPTNSAIVRAGATVQALSMPASTILARLAAGNIKAATVAEIQTLLDLLTKTSFDAQSYIKAILDNTPVVQVVSTNELMGRAGGDIGVIAVPVQSVVARGATDIAPVSMAVQTVLIRGSGDVAALAIPTNAILARGFGDIVALSIGTNGVFGRRGGGIEAFSFATTDSLLVRGSGNIVSQAVGDSEFVGRPASGNLGVITAAQAKAILNTPEILNRDVTSATVVNTTTETTVYSFSIPANTLGTDRMLRLTILARYFNNSGGASNLDVKFKVGATQYGLLSFGSIADSTVTHPLRFISELSAAGGTSSQVGMSTGWLGGANAGTTGGNNVMNTTNDPHISMHDSIAEDSTVAKTLAVTVTHSVAHANTSIVIYTVQLELI